MSTSTKPPRLWKRPARRDKDGNITHAPLWFIFDGGRQFGTGCGAYDIDGANAALVAYINKRHSEQIGQTGRAAETIPVADVLNLYIRTVVPTHAKPKATLHCVRRLAQFIRGKYLSEVNAGLCRQYAETQDSQNAARVDLEYLRAAINHHLNEGLHTSIIKVWLPPKPAPRERWATRTEIAKMLWSAWRYRDKDGKPVRQHIACFILVAVYTGSRHSVVTHTMLRRTAGKPYIDTERGIYYRRPEGSVETKKRRPPIPLPPRLLAHVRRWERAGLRSVAEYFGSGVTKIDKPFRKMVAELGLGKLPPHALRHTAATWLMQAGADPWTTAGYLGMTLKTLAEVYGHHHPDHMSGVHESFQRHRLPTVHQRLTGTVREHPLVDRNAKSIKSGIFDDHRKGVIVSDKFAVF